MKPFKLFLTIVLTTFSATQGLWGQCTGALMVNVTGSSTGGNVATTITTQPTNQCTAIGGSFSLSVVATGVNLTYQWKKNGVNVPTNGTSASYTKTGVVLGDLTTYTVVVSGDCGVTVTSTAATVSACCPVLTAPAPAAVVVDNTCALFGNATEGFIRAPLTACPAGSTLQYSIDNFATAPLSAPPAYTISPINVSTRCSCNTSPTEVSPTTTVRTAPRFCPTSLQISGGNSTITTCNGSQTTLSGSMSGGTWASLNPSVANISSSGVVTGTGVGTVSLSYSITQGIVTTTVYTSVIVTNCPFPILRDSAPPVRITNSICLPGCITVQGSILTSLNVCPSGTVIEYSLDSFRRDSSFRVPVYASTPLKVSTRCRYDIAPSLGFIVSPITTMTTVPAACAPTCVPTLSVAGGLKRETGDAVMADVGLFTNGFSQGTSRGSTYNWSNLTSGQSFSIRPSRTDNPIQGVTSLDLSLISRLILNNEAFSSPYKIIAADVNRDGEVDATDMLIIRRLILRVIDHFPGNISWRFVEKKYAFRDPTNPLAEDFPEMINLTNLQTNVSNADFVAVKLGDVNYSATGINGITNNNVAELRSSKYVTLELADQILEKGKTYEIPLTLASSIQLNALQFGLNWDKNKVESLRIEAGKLPNFGEGNTALFAKEGILTSVWSTANSVNITEPTTVFTLVVQPKTTTRLTEIFSKNDVYTEGVAYDALGSPATVNLKFLMSAKTELQLIQNRPNPFANETIIPFLLPEDGQATLTVSDLLGRVVMKREQVFAKGLNEVVFSVNDAAANGVFIVRLQTANGVAERKIMLNR
jgi:Dockerin type I domain